MAAEKNFLACDPAACEEFWFLRWIVRLRWIIFSFVILLIVAGHNGWWRVGRDSALYRDVGRNIADGKGFTYHGVREKQIFPGLPYFLAGLEKITGREADPLKPKAALWVMLALSLATLGCANAMIREMFPPWVAVCVTTGIGINQVFVQHSHEIMTDMPFLLGVCMVFWGVGRLKNGKAKGLSWTLLSLGAVIAMLMRPTVAALALAGVAATMFHAFQTRQWKKHAIGTAIVGVLIIGYALIHPSGNLFKGKYALNLLNHFSEIGQNARHTLFISLINHHIPECLFGFELPFGLGYILTAMLLCSAAIRATRFPFWSAYIFFTLIMLAIMGSNARYLLMILPMLLVEWALIIHALARRMARIIPWRFAPDWTILIGLAFATVINLALSFNLTMQQRGYEYVKGGSYEHRGFYTAYREGMNVDVMLKLADKIRMEVPARAAVVGPESRILTFLSGRSVYGPADFKSKMNRDAWDAELKSKQIHYAIWGERFFDETGVAVAIWSRKLGILPNQWLEIEPTGRDHNGKPTGIYLGKLFLAETSAPVTQPASKYDLPGFSIGFKRNPLATQPAAESPE